MTSFAEQVTLGVSAAMARRAAATEQKIEARLAREQADIRSAIETNSSVDGKASAPRLRLQAEARAFGQAALAAAEIALEIATEDARAAP
ncbi:hypothetical protein [Aureimonas sp. N4]|uniref:hypothetical protein n=1 Tax=Aureimonas sp. N4 TaxID=1638165 RepID=UPI0007860C7E|nr:hypothetical protein [Aureimonas sp. N4]